MTINSLVLAAALVAAPLAAQAATVVYRASGDVFYDRIDATNTFADFFDDGADDIDVVVSGALTDGVYSGDLFVSDFEGNRLLSSSSVVSVATSPGAAGFQTLTAMFGGLTGVGAGLFSEIATVVFTYVEGDEADGMLAPVDVVIQRDDEIAPVPLPTTLPLLLLGLGGIAAARRARG